MSAKPLLVIAAGGTGGHMFPAQALAEAMLRQGWRVKLSTDERGARHTGGFPHVVEIEQVASATFARGSIAAKLAVPLRITGGTISTVFKMLRDKPDVVVGFGGYPSIPAIAAAWILRLPRMLHEQNAILGRVNQLFARRVAMVAFGSVPAAQYDGVEVVFTGNPLRAIVHQRAGAPYIPPGDYPMSILVTGGSQGARILSDVVPAAILALPDALRSRVRISHQARPEDVDRVARVYTDAGIAAEVESFFKDIPDRIAEAQLVIMRAGASTIADVAAIGRPSILVPLAAAIRDEQTANARGLVDADAAILIPESRLEPGTLSAHIASILSNPDAAVQMAHAALTQGRPDATEHLVELVSSLATRKDTP